jgi:hypothetical protein
MAEVEIPPEARRAACDAYSAAGLYAAAPLIVAADYERLADEWDANYFSQRMFWVGLLRKRAAELRGQAVTSE